MAAPRPPSAEPVRVPHLVALKVLRATRPALVHGDALASAAGLSRGPGLEAALALERTAVERGAYAGSTGVLSLPTAFGTVYLGETFNAVLSLSNDNSLAPSALPASALVAHAPVLKVEMHTGITSPETTGKHVLATVEHPAGVLEPGRSVEAVITHELKELGAHALVCTVIYGTEALAEDGSIKIVSRSFRKVYKFQVNNPLSVRTKAHAPSPTVSPTTFLSSVERTKIFLEVQVHNHCEYAMTFERMRFDPLPGFQLQGDTNEGLFEEGEAPLPPGAVRQFLYVLQATSPASAPPPVQGASQGLGKLDIVWRTPNGEVGRLQSSTLGRRIPQHGPLAPGTMLEASLTAAKVPLGGASPALPPLPTSPVPTGDSQGLVQPSVAGLVFDLLVESVVPAASSASASADCRFTTGEPFVVNLRLRVRDLSSRSRTSTRRLRLAAQHVEWPTPALDRANPARTGARVAIDQRGGHPHHTPQPILTLPSLPGALPSSAQQVSSAMPSRSVTGSTASSARPSYDASSHAIAAGIPEGSARGPAPTLRGVRLPVPTPLPRTENGQPPGPKIRPSPGVIRLGAGLVDLGPVELPPDPPSNEDAVAGWSDLTWQWRFVPGEEDPEGPSDSGWRGGDGRLVRVGGLRILLLENELVGGEDPDDRVEGDKLAKTVLEMDTVAEVWVEN